MSKEEQNGNYAKLPVICSDLSYDDWRRLAGHIDNGFFGSEKTFSVERKNGYYYLNTNKCDDVSMVRVYCQIGVQGIDKIERFGEDTNGWQEIHQKTYESVERKMFVKTLNKN
jgi:hypothetical protein